jgi:hypothetical protein
MFKFILQAAQNNPQNEESLKAKQKRHFSPSQWSNPKWAGNDTVIVNGNGQIRWETQSYSGETYTCLWVKRDSWMQNQEFALIFLPNIVRSLNQEYKQVRLFDSSAKLRSCFRCLDVTRLVDFG